MKWRLSKRALFFLHLIFLVIFIVGLLLNNYTNNTTAGVLIQIIAFIYSIAAFYIQLFSDSSHMGIDEPTIFFTDRQQTICFVIERLYAIVYEHSEEKIITILCDDSVGCGKTELLLKIAQILSNDKAARQFLDFDSYKRYKRLRRRLGYVNFYQYREDTTISKINQSTYILGKTNIIIVDDLPAFTVNRFNDRFVLIFCKESDIKLLSQKSIVTLENFDDRSVKEYYYKKFNSEMSESLLNSIMSYSRGNISIISSILSNQDSIKLFTESAPALFEIEQYINSGNYIKARHVVNHLSSARRSIIAKDPELKFRLEYLEADLMHLENHYEEALEKMEIMRAKYLSDTEKQHRIIEKISHIKKHMGDFEGAISELVILPDSIHVFLELSLNLLALCQYEDSKYLDETNRLLHKIEREKIAESDEHKDSYHTYKAVTATYDYKYDLAHSMIDIAIKKYENDDSKYLNNCYFIKAEIYRHQKIYDMACAYYQKCINAYHFNGDFDIFSLAFVMIKYLNTIKGYSYIIDEIYSLNEIKEKCQLLKMEYNKKLSMYLSQLLIERKRHNQKQVAEISRFFDTHIFIIP